MKRLAFTALLAFSFLAAPASTARAGSCGFNISGCGSIGLTFFWQGNCCGAGCCAPPCLGGYPGYPGVAYPTYPYAYGYPAPAFNYSPAAPPVAPPAPPAPSAAQPVGYYSPYGYNGYAAPAYWYGR